MRVRLWITIALLVLPLYGGSCSWPSKRPVSLSFDELKYCPREYEDKLVATEVYIGIDKDEGYIHCWDDGCHLSAGSKPDRGSRLKAFIPFGHGPNKMDDLPQDFVIRGMQVSTNRPMNEDQLRRFHNSVRVRLNDSRPYRTEDKVRITGVLQVSSASCRINVERIELP
jgi:hypothetical protein